MKKILKMRLIVAMMIGMTGNAAAEGIYSLSSGIDFSSGKYGGQTATDVTYIPVTGKLETDDMLFKLTVPYIRISGPGNVVPNIGQAVNTSNAVRTDEGLGDVVATTSYSLINSNTRGVVFDVTGKIKFATADKYKGLGSGANDYATEASVYKTLGQLSSFGTVGYKVFGPSLGYTLNNVFYGSIGLSNKVNDKTSMGLIYDYRQPTSTLSDAQKIWTLFLNNKIDTQWKTQTYLFNGKGTASPDFGGGFMLTRTY